jgi:hypothetical protein
MKFKFLFIFLILISCFIFAGWYEEPEVRVLDKSGRPVPNATVYIVWEISKSRGSATTKPQLTNENGRAYFKLNNVEFNDADANREYTVYVNYQGKNFSKKFIAGQGTKLRTITIDAYLATFVTTDINNKPLSIKLLIDDAYEVFTDSKGYGQLILVSGKHILKPVFYDLDQKEEFVLDNDKVIYTKIALYSMYLTIVDDFGVPIPNVNVQIGPFSFKTNNSGMVFFENITKPKVSAQISYQKYNLYQTFDLSIKQNHTFALDTHPPSISDIFTKRTNNILQIRATIVDSGRYPSSFSGQKAKIILLYYPEEGVEKQLPMYSVGYNTYEALVELPENKKSVKYIIQATDSIGNTAISSDVFIIEGQKEKPADLEEQKAPLDLFFADLAKTDFSFLGLIALFAILVGVAFYFYKYKLSVLAAGSDNKKEYTYSQGKEKEEGKAKKPPSIFKSIPKKKE